MPGRKTGRGTRARSLARKLAMQALYQWQLTDQAVTDIAAQFKLADDYGGADDEYFAELIEATIERRGELDTLLAKYVDRPVGQLDPVEHAILWIGIYELTARLDVPHRVVINEAVELSKRFGATDGHKYVNAVLDRAAREQRPTERGGRPSA